MMQTTMAEPGNEKGISPVVSPLNSAEAKLPPAESRDLPLWQGRFIQIKQVNGWEYASRVNASGVVAIIAVTDKNELVITEQFRKPVGRQVLDIPAGLAGDEPGKNDESFLSAAERELEEECGFGAKEFIKVMERPSSAGLTDEIITYVLAVNPYRVSEGGGVGNENIITHLIPLDGIKGWIAAKEKEGCLVEKGLDVALNYLR